MRFGAAITLSHLVRVIDFRSCFSEVKQKQVCFLRRKVTWHGALFVTLCLISGKEGKNKTNWQERKFHPRRGERITSKHSDPGRYRKFESWDVWGEMWASSMPKHPRNHRWESQILTKGERKFNPKLQPSWLGRWWTRCPRSSWWQAQVPTCSNAELLHLRCACQALHSMPKEG